MVNSHLLKNEISRAVLAPVSGGKLSFYIRPTIAAIYITKKCNSKCNMCDFWKNEEDPQELTSEQWGVVFSKLKAFGVGFIGINASGEMFTHPQVFEILQHLHDLKIPFGINSNGLLFNKRRSKLLAELKPRQITIGFDGVGNDSYFKTRGLKQGFDKVTQNIQNLKYAGLSNIAIGSVLMHENIDDWVNLVEYTIKQGIAGVRFTAFHEAYFNSDNIAIKSIYQTPEFLNKVDCEIEKLIKLKKETGAVRNSSAYLRSVGAFFANQRDFFPTPCLQGSNRIEVDTYGNVTLCSFVTKPLGNLISSDMESIWNSNVHRMARRDAYQGNCPHCYLSCYSEENIRLSLKGVVPSLVHTFKRGTQLLGTGH